MAWPQPARPASAAKASPPIAGLITAIAALLTLVFSFVRIAKVDIPFAGDFGWSVWTVHDVNPGLFGVGTYIPVLALVAGAAGLVRAFAGGLADRAFGGFSLLQIQQVAAVMAFLLWLGYLVGVVLGDADPGLGLPLLFLGTAGVLAGTALATLEGRSPAAWPAQPAPGPAPDQAQWQQPAPAPAQAQWQQPTPAPSGQWQQPTPAPAPAQPGQWQPGADQADAPAPPQWHQPAPAAPVADPGPWQQPAPAPPPGTWQQPPPPPGQWQPAPSAPGPAADPQPWSPGPSPAPAPAPPGPQPEPGPLDPQPAPPQPSPAPATGGGALIDPGTQVIPGPPPAPPSDPPPGATEAPDPAEPEPPAAPGPQPGFPEPPPSNTP